MHLKKINMSGNFMGDHFGQKLADFLKRNDTIEEFVVHRNCLGKQSAKELLSVLKEYNNVVVNLGEISTEFEMGKTEVVEIERCLLANRNKEGFKSKICVEKSVLDEMSENQQEFGLQNPIFLENDVWQNFENTRIWRI